MYSLGISICDKTDFHFKALKHSKKKKKEYRERGCYLMGWQQRCAWDNDFQSVNEPVKPWAQLIWLHLRPFRACFGASVPHACWRTHLAHLQGQKQCYPSTRPGTGCFKALWVDFNRMEWNGQGGRQTRKNIFGWQLLYFTLIKSSSEPLITGAFPKTIFSQSRSYTTKAHESIILVCAGAIKTYHRLGGL